MSRPPVTTERIERALKFVAYLVQRDDEGEVYLPILDRLEEELADRRRRELPRDRARRLLSGYTFERKADGPTTALAVEPSRALTNR